MTDMYKLPEPGFSSELTSLLFEVERMRASIGIRTTPLPIYAELHNLFDLLMSVVSARIEGNHTTVYEALDNAARADPPGTEGASVADHFKEIVNIADTARYVDSLEPSLPLTHSFIRELHRRTVDGLKREGDPDPGSYRTLDVAITGSAHHPPSWVNVHADMTSLLDFANADYPPQQQMLQVALAHHRFVWIHPFRNGNGRVSRLFTYAMLRRTIFSTRGHSALNPTSVFGNDRSLYISALEGADDLSEEGATAWATFFVQGIRDDLARLVDLQDHRYVSDVLVGPALGALVADGVIDRSTLGVLELVLQAGVVKSGDLSGILGDNSARRSRVLRALVERQLLQPATDGPRFYQLSLARGPLAPRLIRRLGELGILPSMLLDD